MIERLKNWLDALDVDFVQWHLPFGVGSAVLVALSWVAFFVIGPNWGTDFTGGTEIHLKFCETQPERAADCVAKATDIGEVRAGLAGMGLANDAVNTINGSSSGEFVVRIADPMFGMSDLEGQLREQLAALYGPGWVTGLTGSAEVSARFVITYSGEWKDPKVVARALQEVFPRSYANPGKQNDQMIVEIPGLAERITAIIAKELQGRPFVVQATDSVGPKVGSDLRQQGFVSLVATALLILVYVAFRFDVEYAPGAIVALFHDVSMTLGVLVVLQLDFSLQSVGALLTILGYSINDTIVIYDRIRENKDRYRASDIRTLINKSVSETLARTITTSFTVFIALLAFLIYGGPVLRDFAITMLCGLVFGTYSTVYIASPLIIYTTDLKPWLQRMIAVTDVGGEEIPAELATDGPMTESEKRRRARAEADKKQDPV
jgi:preprotein translocase subunit SecF